MKSHFLKESVQKISKVLEERFKSYDTVYATPGINAIAESF